MPKSCMTTRNNSGLSAKIIRPGEGGEGHPEGKFVRPTFFSQFGGTDFKKCTLYGRPGGGGGVCLQFGIET